MARNTSTRSSELEYEQALGGVADEFQVKKQKHSHENAMARMIRGSLPAESKITSHERRKG